MKEHIDYIELEQSLENIKMLTEKLKSSLVNIDNIIEENINSGKGILDGNSGNLKRKEWESIKEEIPSIIETFESQEHNLQLFLESMKKQEE